MRCVKYLLNGLYWHEFQIFLQVGFGSKNVQFLAWDQNQNFLFCLPQYLRRQNKWQSGLCKQQLLFVIFLAKTKTTQQQQTQPKSTTKRTPTTTKKDQKILQIDVTLGGVRPDQPSSAAVETALNRVGNPCVHEALVSTGNSCSWFPVAQPISLIQPGSVVAWKKALWEEECRFSKWEWDALCVTHHPFSSVCYSAAHGSWALEHELKNTTCNILIKHRAWAAGWKEEGWTLQSILQRTIVPVCKWHLQMIRGMLC